MKIYIELLLIFVPIVLFIIWYFWNGFSKWRLLKKYNPEKDLGKLAEDKRKQGWNYDGKNTKQGGEQDAEVGREKSIDGTTVESPNGFEQLERPKLLQTTDVNDDGKTSNSNRKNGNGIRKLLGRRRKSRKG